ncbi:hypothetical protein PSHT_07338, partial [Puccinia striiformis]
HKPLAYITCLCPQSYNHFNSVTLVSSFLIYSPSTRSETSSIRLPLVLSLRVKRVILIVWSSQICHHRPHNHPTGQHRGTSTGSPELSKHRKSPAYISRRIYFYAWPLTYAEETC